MSKVIAIVNGKGGVGKSTICANLASHYFFNEKKNNVLIVDLDFQQSSLDWASIARNLGKEVCDVVSLASDKIEKHLVVKNIQMQIARFRQKYEWIFIDCRGTIDEYTIGAIRSADIVVTPLSSSALDLQATSTLLDMFEQINMSKGGNMILHLVMNNITPNTITLKEAVSLIKANIHTRCGIKICDTVLVRRESYKTSWGNGESVLNCDDKKAKEEFLSFIEEISLDLFACEQSTFE